MAIYRASSAPKPKSKTSVSSLYDGRRHQGPLAFAAGATLAVPITVVAMLALVSAKPVHVVQVKTAADTLSCSQPVTGGSGGGGGAGGEVLGEETTNLPVGGAGGGNQQPPTPFVEQFVLNATGSINNTGPNSNNTISSDQTVITTVTNNNNVNLSNSNSQSASSGDASVEDNTTGGSATTGDAANSNTTDIGVSITN